MAIVNRCAIIVVPKQPYVDWANSSPGPPFDPEDCKPSVYLATEVVTGEDMVAVVKESWKCLFDLQLDGWMRDPKSWPKKRSFKIFNEWFDVRVTSRVEDMCEWPLEREED